MNPKKAKLPRFELKINPDADAIVDAVSLVDAPAIESDFIFFSKNPKEYSEYQFKVESEDRMELLGAAMIPNIDIFRKDKDGEEYNVFFTTETIRQIAQQYSKMGFQNNMNIEHSSIPAKSYIFQSYITDKSRGMNAPKGINVPDGSWIVGVKVEDKEVWDSIKAGKVKGFSIEGMFQYLESKFSLIDNNNTDADEEIIDDFLTCLKTNQFKMSNKLKELIQYVKLSLDGKTYSESQLKISDKAVGGKVEMIQGDGSLTPAEDGSYTLDNGFSFSTKDGLIVSIEGQEAQASDVPASGETAVSAATSTSGSTATDAPEGSPAEESTESPADEETEDDTAIADLTDRVAQLEDAVSQLIQALQMSKTNENKLSTELAKQTAEVNLLNEKFGKLVKTPVQPSKTNTSFYANADNEDELRESITMMAESFKK